MTAYALAVHPPIYAADPEPDSDDAFEPGELAHLVAGNHGRLLDARRTPVTVTAVSPEIGAFEVEVGAFEDAGARWELALDEIDRFQFAGGRSRASAAALAELAQARERFGGELTVEGEPGAAERTRAVLDTTRNEARTWLEHEIPAAAVDVDGCVARREGDPLLFDALHRFLAARGLEQIERRFASTFVSNPRSGEVVKGHAIVLAELGLRPYHGPIVRDPRTFTGEWSKERRAEHLIARLAFVQALWFTFGAHDVVVYRGAAAEQPLRPRQTGSFVSATFSKAVAEAHFEGGPATQAAFLWRGRIPVTRLVMTFLETEALNERFHEAEAVLLDGTDVM